FPHPPRAPALRGTPGLPERGNPPALRGCAGRRRGRGGTAPDPGAARRRGRHPGRARCPAGKRGHTRPEHLLRGAGECPPRPVAGLCRGAARCTPARLRHACACDRRLPLTFGTRNSVMTTPDHLAHSDVAYQLHAYTNAQRHREEGPCIMARGSGIHVYDTAGKEYIEGMAGLWSVAVGFSEPRLAEAARRQMECLPFYHTFSHKSNVPSIELAEKLIGLTGGRMA